MISMLKASASFPCWHLARPTHLLRAGARRGLVPAAAVADDGTKDVGKIIRSRYSCPQLNTPLADKSFSKFILDEMTKYGDDPAIVEGGAPSDAPSHTFKSARAACYRLAQAYRKLGFVDGQCVAIVTPNHVDYFTPMLAAGLVKCHSTTVNPQYTEKELLFQLENTSSSIVFCHSVVLEKVVRAVCIGSMNVKIYTIDDNISRVPGAICSLNELLRSEPMETVDTDSFPGQSSKNFDNSSIFMIPFSSGTTGTPKGVMVSHRNFLSNILQVLAIDNNYTRDARIVPLPLYHAFGILSSMSNHYIGAKTVLTATFDFVQFLELIQEHRVARAGLVPPIILGLAKHPVVAKYDLSSLKTIGCGAAPLGAEVQRAAAKRLNCVVKQGWGMTELSPCASLFPDEIAQTLPSNASCFGSVGFLVPASEGKVVDPATGVDLSPYVEGEICIRGPHVMKGYYRNEAATAQMIDKDGWLHTGDIGKFDSDEYLYITDRCKELIKYKAFQVAPAELEALINTMEGVKDCVVIPVPDEEAGEIPRAYVVRQDELPQGRQLTERAVEEFVAASVSSHKRLRGGVRFTDIIPKSPAGKILRRVQREIDRNSDKGHDSVPAN
jgi:acyl-CoA synthetase (AMP-forming)/AMP-acid ligase II